MTMGLAGSAKLAGTLGGGFRARGKAGIDVKDLYVRNGPWDADRRSKEILHVPRARLDTGLTIDSKHCLLQPATLRGPGTELDLSVDFLFLRPLGLVIEVTGPRFDLDSIAGRIGGARFGGEGSMEASIIGPTKDLDITGSLELGNFSLGDWKFGRVAGDLHWHTRDALSITSVRGHRGESDFEADLRLLFPYRRGSHRRKKLEMVVEALVPEGQGRAEDLLPIFFGKDLGA
ncbi:MAG: hypothetical protein VX498_02200, partial [Myxococcota bacterium]|nr:hypothetical protein [Myxococcota bacterium]